MKAVGYYRVSTKHQAQDEEDTRHGLDGQRLQVRDYAEREGLDLIAEYHEVETGTSKRQRVVVYQAIKHAQEAGAVLLIADISRLARSVKFITTLQESGIDFRAIDMPSATPMTLQLMAVFAEEYARAVSKGTKRGLAAAKAKGKQLGAPDHLNDAARAKAAELKKQEARAAYQPVAGYIKVLRQDLGLSLQQIADRLNEEGHRTRTGKAYHRQTVSRILQRAA